MSMFYDTIQLFHQAMKQTAYTASHLKHTHSFVVIVTMAVGITPLNIAPTAAEIDP